MNKIKAVLDAVFALPPDVIQQEEVATIGAAVTLLSLHISADQKAAFIALLGVAYLAVRGIYRAASK